MQKKKILGNDGDITQILQQARLRNKRSKENEYESRKLVLNQAQD